MRVRGAHPHATPCTRCMVRVRPREIESEVLLRYYPRRAGWFGDDDRGRLEAQPPSTPSPSVTCGRELAERAAAAAALRQRDDLRRARAGREVDHARGALLLARGG